MLLGTHIALLCAAVAFPLLLFAAYGAHTAAEAESTHLEEMAQSEARDIALLVGIHLTETKAALKVLAASRLLETDDLNGFYRHAQEAQTIPGVNVVLRTPDGRQVLNTRQHPGGTLPQAPNPLPVDSWAIGSGTAQVSNLFVGTLSQSPMYVVEQSITRRDGVKYLLGLSVPVTHLAKVLEDRPVIPGGWAGLIDGTGIVLARTVDPEAWVGTSVRPQSLEVIARANPLATATLVSREGINVFLAFHRVADTPWTVAVVVPEAVLKAPMRRSLAWTAALAAIAIAISATLAQVYRRYLQHQATRLNAAALALGAGEPIRWTQCRIRELDGVGAALTAAERELLRRSDEREKLLQALGQSPVIVRSLGGVVSFWGKGAEELYGYSRTEAMGRLTHDLLATDFPSPLNDINNQLIRNERWEGRLSHRTADGRRLTVQSHWALWRDPFTQAPVAVVETNSDMTARAAQAAAEEADRAKTAFLAAISHDLRQPFQALRLFLQVLEAQATGPSADVVERMGKALTSAEEMLTSISQFSVLETGTLETTATSFSVGEVLREVAEDCAACAASAVLKLRCVPSAAHVHTDRVLFKRMVRNLAMNAIRYTRSGGVLIGCRHHQGGLLVQVVDTGIGIPASKLDHIFDAFFQVGDAPQHGAHGLGLGLAIVSRLAQTLGLPISVTSVRGRGSRFCIAVDPMPGMPAQAVPDQPSPALARGS